MSRFIIALLAIIATTSAKPHVLSYAPGYYGGFIAPSYTSYPLYSYPFTPVTYVETIPSFISAPAPVATFPIVPAKLTAKNSEKPPPPAKWKQSLPAPPPAAPAPAATPAPAQPGAPAKLITITKTIPVPELPDLQGLLQQVLELPPVKQIAELKTNKLQTIAGLHSALQNALQEKLAPIAALLP